MKTDLDFGTPLSRNEMKKLKGGLYTGYCCVGDSPGCGVCVSQTSGCPTGCIAGAPNTCSPGTYCGA